MSASRTLISIAVAFGALGASFYSHGQASSSAALAQAIGKLGAGAAIVPVNEIGKECGPVPKTASLVSVDLNGDGLTDAATLVKIRETGKVVPWNGAQLREAEFAFAIYLAQKDGTFVRTFIKRFLDYMPVDSFIGPVPTGTVHNRETNRDVTIAHPGVMLVHCGKSAAAYYMSGNRVHIIPTAD